MIICDFCKQEAPHTPIQALESKGLKIYFCENCNTEYTLWNDQTPAARHMYVTINDKLYRWTITRAGQGVKAYLRYYKDPGIPGAMVNRNQELLQIFTESIPEITPDNIEQKIRFILLFL